MSRPPVKFFFLRLNNNSRPNEVEPVKNKNSFICELFITDFEIE